MAPDPSGINGFDISKVTLEEIDAEYNRTLDKLERLSKLRESVVHQKHRTIYQFIREYNLLKAQEEGR